MELLEGVAGQVLDGVQRARVRAELGHRVEAGDDFAGRRLRLPDQSERDDVDLIKIKKQHVNQNCINVT